MAQAASLLPLAVAIGLIGTSAFGSIVQSSTGVSIANMMSDFGVPFYLQLNVFSLIAAAIAMISVWPRKQKVFVLDFSVFAAPAR